MPPFARTVVYKILERVIGVDRISPIKSFVYPALYFGRVGAPVIYFCKAALNIVVKSRWNCVWIVLALIVSGITRKDDAE